MCIGCLCREDLPDPGRDYRVISTDIALTVVELECEIVAAFEWDEVDPWAVTVDFGRRPPEPWVISRELLKAGLHYDAGLGDVRFCGDVLRPNRRLMILDSPGGHVALRFDPIEVAFFVAAVDRATLGRAADHSTDGGGHV